MSNIRYFEVLEGEHHQDRKYVKGEKVASPHNLVTLFPNKFKEVEAPVAASKSKTAAPEGDGDEGSKKSTPPTPPAESGLGEDVTKEFPAAAEADYRVFRKGKKYFVASPDALEVALNKAALVKDDVAEFVQDLAK